MNIIKHHSLEMFVVFPSISKEYFYIKVFIYKTSYFMYEEYIKSFIF